MKGSEACWKNIIEKNGTIDREAVYKELHDYYSLIDRMQALTSYVTDNQLSKSTYGVEDIIKLHDEKFVHKATLQDDARELLESNPLKEDLIVFLKEYILEEEEK